MASPARGADLVALSSVGGESGLHHGRVEVLMAEVVHVFDERVLLHEVPYAAQVAARRNGHIWEGWLEFFAEDGSDVRRTPRETTQPNLDAIIYWAQGLSTTYLEGALQRTLPRSAAFAAPRADTRASTPTAVPADARRRVLDPYSAAAKGERYLRTELAALAPSHLRDVIRAFGLAEPRVDLEGLGRGELVELIVTRVQPA